MSLKLIFAGTPMLALPALNALLESEHQVIAVYTQPDRKAGRGRKLQASPIKTRALEAGIPVEQPLSLRDKLAIQQLQSYQADLLIVVAYGLLLPDAVLKAPKQGCINLHFSLLPRWRGAAPIQHAILNGDKETGISIMQIVKALDAGDILACEATPISDGDNCQILGERLANRGAKLLCQTLAKKNIEAKPQNPADVTYAHKIQKNDARIEWQKTAVEIDRQVRAYHGWPVAFTDFAGDFLRIWEAKPVAGKLKEKPGTFMLADKEIMVVCEEGALQLKAVQLPGKRIMNGREFAQWYQQRQLC